jgi:hypothetical protein
VLALQFLAGYVQGSFYLVGVVCLYYVYSALWPESDSDLRSRTRALGQLVVLGLLSLGVSAFQLFPTARLVAQAARFAGIPYADAIEGGWYARNYLSSFFPFFGISSNPPHRELAEAVSYVGWILTPMIPLAFFDGARRRIAIFFAAIACIALAIFSTSDTFARALDKPLDSLPFFGNDRKNVKVVDHKTTADSIIVVGNTAYDYGVFRALNSRDGQTGNPGYGKYVIVWQKQSDGRWLMHLDIWNNSPPPQP